MLKAVNDGSYNFVEVVKEYGEKAKIMKKLFLENGFKIVYDQDEGVPIADGFYFTISYPGIDGEQLLEELIYYGISAIALSITGSERHEGLRACVSLVRRDQFPALEARLKKFHEHHPVIMISLRFTVIGILASLVSVVPATAQDTAVNGVRVAFGVEKKMFPSRWHRKGVDAHAVSLTPSEIPRAGRVIGKAIAKYPSGLADYYLDRVYVLKSLWFYGYPYGGTFSKKTLYLTLDENNPLNTDLYLEGRFHHEFSSILWKENLRKLDRKKWISFNPDGFIYGEGGLDAIRSGVASMETDPGYFSIGFLNRYAMTEIEQDINVLAQNLFTGGPEFWKIVDANERIRGKVLLLIGFYHSLDPVFTETYFRRLAD